MTTLINKSIRNTEYYNMQNELDTLYNNSIKNAKFKNLMNLITSDKNILLAYRNIKNNKGAYTPGLDGITIKDVDKLTEMDFIKIIKNKFKNYKPKKVKRVLIPKANGNLRPLGIPSIYDRIVQQCILQILEPICEAKFYDNSYGFRPNRSTENAIAVSMKMMQQCHLQYVVDVDLKSFFDNINHNKLIKQIWALGIQDKKLLSIIKTMLKAPIQDYKGNIYYPDKGTPQGGVLSPLLSNIVLNELDWWISSQWENIPTKHDYKGYMHKNGTISKTHKYEALRKNTKLKEMYIVRYADDFKIFCRNRKDADKIKYAVIQWFKNRLNLSVNENKTCITNLKKHYTKFLGFELKLIKKNNKYIVKSKICSNTLKRIKKDLKTQIKSIVHSKDLKSEHQKIAEYNAKVIGIHNYYKIATCVQLDLDKIQRCINYVLYNRFNRGRNDNRLKKKGKITNEYIKEYYGKSKQMRFINDEPIIPIGYIRTKNAMNKRRKINKYTKEGRKLIHKNLTLNLNIFIKLMENISEYETVLFSKNKIAKYMSQKGKCIILNEILEYNEIHCHHIIPKSIEENDNYNNLVIIHKDIHKLIHATNIEIIEYYLNKYNLSKKQINKINYYRNLAGNSEI